MRGVADNAVRRVAEDEVEPCGRLPEKKVRLHEGSLRHVGASAIQAFRVYLHADQFVFVTVAPGEGGEERGVGTGWLQHTAFARRGFSQMHHKLHQFAGCVHDPQRTFIDVRG
ncbi:hypothetical protein HRbin16_02395 [bacterium HR16]|nr:hypothetical protein HRbin16_02395 [bacterium HR16]